MLLLTVWNGLVHWLQEHLLPCPSVRFLGVSCPGCGMQRSFIALLKGDLAGSWHYHPATIPMFLLILLLLLHLRFRYRWGAKALVFMQALVAAFSISFYVYKIIYY